MKLKSIKIKNFRGYKDEVEIDFNNLTTFVGKNDIGKSTILEALDIFFNDGKGIIKLDIDDINKKALSENDHEILISAKFIDLPETIIIDSTNETTLKSEYVLTSSNELEIIKKYPNAGKAKVFFRCVHPSNPDCANLLLKKDTELRKMIESSNIPCSDKNKKASMRTAIWNYYSTDLQLQEQEIDISKGESSKSIWEKFKTIYRFIHFFNLTEKIVMVIVKYKTP
nr:AAA family ATPase [Acinetobacter guillouiae]